MVNSRSRFRNPDSRLATRDSNAREIIRRRLAGQFLTGPRARTASEVVRALGAVQAQDYLDAKWALALRTVEERDADVERELDAGRILRTHVLRPTWHFVAAEDIRWILSLSGPRVNAINSYRYHQLELDSALFRKAHKVITRALAGGKHLTRLELAQLLERSRIATGPGNRLAHIVMQAELDGIICSGPRRGKQFTYALLEERVAPTAPIDRDEALGRLALRYFGTRGPATGRDFSWWSGLTMAEVKRAIEVAGSGLDQVTIGGKLHWLIPSASPVNGMPSAHLLPMYDEYFIGLQDRTAMGRHLGDPLFALFIFVNGEVVGQWRRTIEVKRVVIELDFLTRITAADERRIAVEARRLGQFLGLPVELRAGAAVL